MEYIEGYVAFVDILGFSNYVLEEQNAQKVSELFSFVDKFCYLFNTSPDLKVNVSFFSDSILMSSDDFQNLIVPIYIAESYLKSELKLLFRGGITKGKYYNTNGVTFGPAVITAYRLENQAVYSRIVLDDKLIDSDIKQCMEVFRDTDGKWCLNLSGMDLFKGTMFGPHDIIYPDGDPGDIILNNYKEARKKLLEEITSHLGTSVADKYIWRVKPFNYTCEQLAKRPEAIEMFSKLGYKASDSFSKALLELRISNFDYELEQ